MPAQSMIEAVRPWVIEDIAAFFHVSVNTVRMWKRDGDLPPSKKRGRRLYWSQDDIRAMTDTPSRQSEGA